MWDILVYSCCFELFLLLFTRFNWRRDPKLLFIAAQALVSLGFAWITPIDIPYSVPVFLLKIFQCILSLQMFHIIRFLYIIFRCFLDGTVIDRTQIDLSLGNYTFLYFTHGWCHDSWAPWWYKHELVALALINHLWQIILLIYEITFEVSSSIPTRSSLSSGTGAWKIKERGLRWFL